MQILFIALISGLLTGCAQFSSSKEEKVLVSSAPSAPVVETNTSIPLRELGSIWSDDSNWTQFYSTHTAKNAGDSVLIKLTDSFRALLLSKVGKDAVANPTILTAAPLLGTLTRGSARSAFSITADQRLRLGADEVEVTVHAKVREQDIAGDDSISADQLYDLSFNVKRSAAQEPKKTEPPESEKDSAAPAGSGEKS